jgi:hypothetical protein
MNERIKKLAEQARFETNGVICSFGNYKVDNEYFFAEDFIEDELAKFAELIVRECIELNRQELAFNAFERLLNKYKEHFGVE